MSVLTTTDRVMHPRLFPRFVISCSTLYEEAKTTKEKSWGILVRDCLFSSAKCTRSILWPRAKHIPRNRINILSLLSTELHNEWRAKSSNAEEEETLEWGCRQWRNSFYRASLLFVVLLKKYARLQLRIKYFK